MKTIKDVVELLNDNRDSGNSELAQHALTLVGRRKRGSTTIAGLDHIPEDRELMEHHSDLVTDGCVCYKVHAPELEGYLGAIPLWDAVYAKLNIQLRDGKHGPELYLDQSWEQALTHRSDDVFIIVGDFEGERAIFTWHPGRPLAPLSKGIKMFTAVKTHRG